MAVPAVRLRAAAAVALSGSLVLPSLLVLPSAVATVVSLLIAIAVTLPSTALGSARRPGRAEG